MKRHSFARSILSFLLLVLFVIPSSAFAAKPTATPPLYPEATLAPDAPAYDANFPENLEPEQLYAWSAILIESVSGDVIFEKSPDELRFPASTTKIMTCYLGITMVEDLDMVVTVSPTAIDVPADSSTMKLQAGEELSFRDVLYGTMLLSANDGANVIAETVSGSITEFVNLMNQTALSMGCTNTHFNNAHGYTDPSHYTTARDLAIMARAAMENDLFREIVATRTYSLPKTNLSRARSMTNTNELFNPGTDESPNKYYFPDSIGIKTGNTDASQYCFVGGALRDGVELISVVMYTGKRARWADTIKLMNYGFSQYMSVTPIDLYNMNPITIETNNYSTSDSNRGKILLACQLQDPSVPNPRITTTASEVKRMAANLTNLLMIQYTRDFAAPIAAGEVIGTMTYFPQYGDPVVYSLTASRSVARRENAPKTLEEIANETYADPNPFPPFSAELLMVFLGPVLLVAALVIGFFVLRKKHRAHRMKTPRPSRRYVK